MNKEEKLQAIEEAIKILNEAYSLNDLGKNWMCKLLSGMGDIRVALSLLKKSK